MRMGLSPQMVRALLPASGHFMLDVARGALVLLVGVAIPLALSMTIVLVVGITIAVSRHRRRRRECRASNLNERSVKTFSAHSMGAA